MKKVSELKKLVPGLKFKLIQAKYPEHKFLNVTRAIKTVQSNALTFEPVPQLGSINPSWLYFPKASEFMGTEKGFKILDGTDVLLEYEEVK